MGSEIGRDYELVKVVVEKGCDLLITGQLLGSDFGLFKEDLYNLSQDYFFLQGVALFTSISV